MRVRPGGVAELPRPDPAGLAALLLLAGAGLSFAWLAYEGDIDRLIRTTPRVEIPMSLPAPVAAAAPSVAQPNVLPSLMPEPDRRDAEGIAALPPMPVAPAGAEVANIPKVTSIPDATPPAPASSFPAASKPPAAPRLASAALPSAVEPEAGPLPNYPQLLPHLWPSLEAPAWQRYARPFDIQDPRPRIAIVIVGLGLLHGETSAAIGELPAEMTLSFSPYSHGLDGWIGEARAYGHEVMLDLPTAAGGTGNALDWVLGRGREFVGLAGVDGGGLGASPGTMAPLLTDIGQHGLMYLEPPAGGGVAAAEAGRLRVASASANLLVDAEPDRDFIDAQLARLEQQARQTGFAVGIAAGYPATIERLAAWSRDLDQRSFALAPVSALVGLQAWR